MLRGAIIGFGAVAQHGHLPAYASLGEAGIVAVVDPAAERRAVARETLPEAAVFAAVAELAGVELDFVDICTPPAMHGEQILNGLWHGWHVLCEKPLLLDSTKLKEARSLARERCLALVPMHNWKFAPIIRRATELLRSGIVGPLRTVKLETLRKQECAAADPALVNWRRDPTISGGGILVDHGWHALYLVSHWFGQTLAEVQASLHRTTPGAAEDEAYLKLQFPKGRAEIFLSWNATVRRNTIRLIGDDGEIMIGDDTLEAQGRSERFKPGLSAGSYHSDWFAVMLPEVIKSFHHSELACDALDETAFCLSVIQRAYAADGAAAMARS
jgi:predicted dehydrogenase